MKQLLIPFLIIYFATTFISCTQDFEQVDVPRDFQPRTQDSGNTETDFFYAYDGKKESFTIRRDRVIIKASSEIEAQELVENPIFRSAYTMSYIWVIGTINPNETNLGNLMQIPGVVDVTYGLEHYDRTIQFPKDIIYAELNGTSAEEAFNKIGINDGIKSMELSNQYHNGYRIILNAKLDEILNICRRLYKSGTLGYAEPSFIRETKSYNELDQPSSRNFDQSEATSAIDIINLNDIWEISPNGANVKVAVIDTGVDLTHPDLSILPGYDATKNSPGGANGSPYVSENPSLESNAHGTACAGIIGARYNSAGINGVAPFCQIIPVRVGWCTIFGVWVTDNASIADGINYAWSTANADVLNNSWGQTNGSQSFEIDRAINDALALGRNGKGCVVVFSSGNDTEFGIGGGVMYPGNSKSEILTVGAVANDGRRYAGGGGSWGSNYGPELDVMAPGVNIYTTDIQGNAGYSAGNYYDGFSGTSAAAPYVSGIAALILSECPVFTQQEVTDLIEKSAQKVGGYDYTTIPNRKNGTWHNEMGYGLVDAYGALAGVPDDIKLIGPEIVFALSDKPILYHASTFNRYDDTPSTVTWDVVGGTIVERLDMRGENVRIKFDNGMGPKSVRATYKRYSDQIDVMSTNVLEPRHRPNRYIVGEAIGWELEDNLLARLAAIKWEIDDPTGYGNYDYGLVHRPVFLFTQPGTKKSRFTLIYWMVHL